MGGFSSVTGDETIMFADNCSFDGTQRGGKLTTDGQLFIGSTASPHVRKGSITAGTGITVTNGAGSITIASTASATDLHTAKLIVSSAGTVGTGANYATITAALAAASSGDTIFVMPGTYTENLTLAPSVNIVSYDADAITPNVTIVGKCTFTQAGTVSISGIRLQTNSDFFLAITGSAASIVNLKNCYLNCSNNTGISYTTSNASAKIMILDCSGNIGTTGISLFSNTTAGGLNIEYCTITNTGAASTASTTSSGPVSIQWSTLQNPLSTSSTGTFLLNHSYIDCAATNSIAVTTAGTGTTQLQTSIFFSGTQSALSIGAGTTVLADNIVPSSTNANAITGSGTLIYSEISFTNTSKTINSTLTTTKRNTSVGTLNIGSAISLTTPVPLMRDSSTGDVGVGPASGFTWTDVTGATQTLAVQNGYLTDRGGGVTYTLPSTANLGDIIKIVGKSGLATITPNANQQILIGSASGTVGVTGTAVSNNAGDCIELICTTSGASTVWRSDSVIGTWTLS